MKNDDPRLLRAHERFEEIIDPADEGNLRRQVSYEARSRVDHPRAHSSRRADG